MNRFFRICFLCVAGVSLFFLGMWFSSYLFYKNELKLYETYPMQKEINDYSMEYSSEYEMVETTTNATVDMNTEFVVIKENLVTGDVNEIAEELPSQFVGMDRADLEEFFKDYAKSPVLKDREEGFISASVESYSPQKLVVKKVYEPLQLEEKFYLKAEENYVVVYYGDNSTVYMYTNIRVDSLPEQTREEIEHVKEIDTYDSLYSFLESYTS